MIKITLLSQDFRFVHEGWMPEFKEQPQIIVWNGQHFKHHVRGTYLAAFAYNLVSIPDPRQSTLFREEATV